MSICEVKKSGTIIIKKALPTTFRLLFNWIHIVSHTFQMRNVSCYGKYHSLCLCSTVMSLFSFSVISINKMLFFILILYILFSYLRWNKYTHFFLHLFYFMLISQKHQHGANNVWYSFNRKVQKKREREQQEINYDSTDQ